MSYKDILVHLDPSPRSAVRLTIAADLAKKSGATLVGLHCYELPGAEIFVGDPPMYFDARQVGEMLDRMRADKDAQCAKLRTAFEAETTARGIKSEWRQVEGPTADVLSLHGRYADLLVVGQPAPDGPDAGVIDPALLMGSGRPLLVIPYAGNFATIGQTILIGWNATPEAAGAVADAMPLLHHAKKIIVVAINPRNGITAHGTKSADDLIHHLARHSIQAEARHLAADDISEGEALISYISDVSADLLVCGMYGHSRLREMAFGGATRSLLIAMTVPCLLAH